MRTFEAAAGPVIEELLENVRTYLVSVVPEEDACTT